MSRFGGYAAQRLASWLRRMLSMTVLTTRFSSSLRRVVASNWRRRSSSGPRSSLSKTSVSALTESDRKFAQDVQGGRALACFVAADLRYVDADVVGEGLLLSAHSFTSMNQHPRSCALTGRPHRPRTSGHQAF